MTTNTYDNDLRGFYAKVVGDADVHEITRDLEAVPGKYRYVKEKSWNAPRARKEDAYGVWVEVVELWSEEQYRFAYCDGTVKRTKVRIHHTDIEYYAYGNVDNCLGSRYVHTVREVEA